VSDLVLDVRQVSRRYGDRIAVSEASLQLDAGRIACLLGPSGCGKSTLLRLIAGLEPVDHGEIAIGGHTVSAPGFCVPPESRGVGLVFQDCALFPHLSVFDNIGFGLTRLSKAERAERVQTQLARFHIENLAQAWPHMLSGGEQQRVAIARALARNPAILLLDEPFSSLDGHLRAQVRQSLLADLREAGASVLIVTHDPEEAMLIADDMILMAEGRILQTGAPEHCYRRPGSITAARLLGDLTVLPATVEGGVANTALGPVPAKHLNDGGACVLVRPEAVRLGNGGVPARVLATSFAGAFHAVTLEIGDYRLVAQTTAAPPAPGQMLDVSLDCSQPCVVVAPDSGG
jgi:iron(III) transport system ATP-binding protein